MHYDVVTREYKASCTVWKANQMMSFEDVLNQYEPMISASIRKLNIYRDHEQFRQAGRIALWQANASSSKDSHFQNMQTLWNYSCGSEEPAGAHAR